MKLKVWKRAKSTLGSALLRIVGPEAQPVIASKPSNEPASSKRRREWSWFTGGTCACR
jgi:hypothetical protein